MRKNPSVQYLHVFGCKAYAHVLKEKWLKLDNNVVKSIFINYGIDVKVYKLRDHVV
jgi:hypothetical protein